MPRLRPRSVPTTTRTVTITRNRGPFLLVGLLIITFMLLLCGWIGYLIYSAVTSYYDDPPRTIAVVSPQPSPYISANPSPYPIVPAPSTTHPSASAPTSIPPLSPMAPPSSFKLTMNHFTEACQQQYNRHDLQADVNPTTNEPPAWWIKCFDSSKNNIGGVSLTWYCQSKDSTLTDTNPNIMAATAYNDWWCQATFNK